MIITVVISLVIGWLLGFATCTYLDIRSAFWLEEWTRKRRKVKEFNAGWHTNGRNLS